MTSRTSDIARGFSENAASYESHARVQARAARWLGEVLAKEGKTLPEGPVLEIGCGTGLVTRELFRRLPDRGFRVTDLAGGMVEACKKTSAGKREATFETLDATGLSVSSRYALIASGFTFQWFSDFEDMFKRLHNALLPGGLLIATFQGKGSFPEWKRAAREAGVAYTGNPMPDPEAILAISKSVGFSAKLTSRTCPDRFDSAAEFFKSLSFIGAGTSVSGEIPTASRLRKVIRAWNAFQPGGVTATYRVHLLVARKDAA